MARTKRRTTRSPRSAARRTGATGRLATTYWDATREPLYCLVFLLPMVLVYEFGAIMLRPAVWPEQQLFAQSLVERVLEWFGAVGFWAPGVLLLATLLIWHLLARHSWQMRAWIPLLMAVECLLLTLPLFMLDQVLLQIAALSTPEVKLRLLLSIGAGIYEELVFRLYLIVGLVSLLADGLRLPRKFATPAAAALSAIAFAVCHMHPIGSAEFTWPTFLFYCAAGGYLALLFVQRGLGISTGCHTAYNLLLVVAPLVLSR